LPEPYSHDRPRQQKTNGFCFYLLIELALLTALAYSSGPAQHSIVLRAKDMTAESDLLALYNKRL